jgi:hypothetical protein
LRELGWEARVYGKKKNAQAAQVFDLGGLSEGFKRGETQR